MRGADPMGGPPSPVGAEGLGVRWLELGVFDGCLWARCPLGVCTRQRSLGVGPGLPLPLSGFRMRMCLKMLW